MSGKAAKVKCTEKQIEILEHIIKSTRSEQRLIARAKIIWNAFHGKRNDEISKIVGLDRGQVGVWRRRWKMSSMLWLPLSVGSHMLSWFDRSKKCLPMRHAAEGHQPSRPNKLLRFLRLHAKSLGYQVDLFRFGLIGKSPMKSLSERS